ncbi:similar to Saccharomyces cerevisiae YJL117W PHO86 Endoplasmic reticulum (ER) resident protein required for ER exit of the high-affinity phosphate transporter Pho84p [Maudiozyma saulgeensis]|uniref:Similar to Saccharomyces cerevisiae YJL117W PHO86 Endoplasmic reticulum (ER) resident protein required for ER exit of the high-affinity phosphate transporter Pho84p n=1 Tax=Maudiozyma saulgeensis TaxID=1789683 RepID=A0A1X7QXV9_9SACH|nr:similar to Saccharomyces cerevisiae YJL117W PHO86 Endoplasmic reticulum (ER) resident protein required for ER exit of the high-affinity phosphate transporter Pho84p [Kazachstania saulgeensis]
MSKDTEVQVPKMKVKQIDASLDKPLDADAPPTIYQTKLTPELASAALNLSVDFLKQQQSLCNYYLIKSPIVIIVDLLFLIIYLGPRLNYPPLKNSNDSMVLTFNSVSGYLYHIYMMNKFTFLSAALFTVMLTSFVFTLVSRLSDTFFKTKIDQIVKGDGEIIFGFKLPEIIKINKDTPNLPENTNIVVYRNTPIALVSVSENQVLSTPDSLTMTISAIGCRRVYVKSGILEDLLDWTMIRTKAIGSGKNKLDKSMKVLIEIYSFDDAMKKILTKKGYSCISVGKAQENRLLSGLFGVKKELWGVQFHVKNPAL